MGPAQHAGSELLGDLGAGVPRAVVDDDELEWCIRLGPHGGDSLSQEGFSVEHRDDHAHRGAREAALSGHGLPGHAQPRGERLVEAVARVRSVQPLVQDDVLEELVGDAGVAGPHEPVDVLAHVHGLVEPPDLGKGRAPREQSARVGDGHRHIAWR